MTSRIWFINLALAAGVIFFGIKTYQVWFEPEKPITNPKSVRMASQPEIRLLPKTVPSQTSYQIVVEKTIFSPERKEQVKKAETAAGKAPAKFNLLGIIISDGYKFAFISDATKPGTKIRRVKEDDSLDDLKVSAIQNDRIILANADNRQEVLLYDTAKVVRREQVQKDTEPIVITGSEPQNKQSPLTAKEEKTPANPPANPLTAATPVPTEKKSESPPSDKKPAVSQPTHQPAPPKTQTKPVQDDMNNSLLNLFRGMK